MYLERRTICPVDDVFGQRGCGNIRTNTKPSDDASRSQLTARLTSPVPDTVSAPLATVPRGVVFGGVVFGRLSRVERVKRFARRARQTLARLFPGPGVALAAGLLRQRVVELVHEQARRAQQRALFEHAHGHRGAVPRIRGGGRVRIFVSSNIRSRLRAQHRVVRVLVQERLHRRQVLRQARRVPEQQLVRRLKQRRARDGLVARGHDAARDGGGDGARVVQLRLGRDLHAGRREQVAVEPVREEVEVARARG